MRHCSLDVADDASVDDLLAALGREQPALAPALDSVLPVVAGSHVERDERLHAIEVTSLATASGNDQPMEGRLNGDPYCAPVCPGCGTEWPETRDRHALQGDGEIAGQSEDERARALEVAKRHGVAKLEDTLPVSVVGSG